MMEYPTPLPPFQPYTYPQADPIPDSLLQVQLDLLARASPTFNFFIKSALSLQQSRQFLNRESRIRVACLLLFAALTWLPTHNHPSPTIP